MDDITDISQHVLRERQGRDRGRWDRMREAWEPDRRVRVNWIDGSAAAFVDGSIAMAASGITATHRMSPPVVIEVRAVLGGVEVDLASRVRLAAMTCVYASDSVTPVVPGVEPDLGTVTVAAVEQAQQEWLHDVDPHGSVDNGEAHP